MFNKEADFENALIALLSTKSWEKEVLRYPTEEKLIANWQEHLNKTNQHIDKLDAVASHGNEPDFGAGAGIENALCAKRLYQRQNGGHQA